MAEEFGAAYTKAATHSQYTLPLTARATLEADLAPLPFEVVFFERGARPSPPHALLCCSRR